jgi:hypothetical protein
VPLGGLTWTNGIQGVRIGGFRDPVKTCAIIQDMITNRKTLQGEIDEGRAALEARFSPEVMNSRYLALYDYALKRRHK